MGRRMLLCGVLVSACAVTLWSAESGAPVWSHL